MNDPILFSYRNPNICEECQIETDFIISRNGDRVCCECGMVDSSYLHLVSEPEYDCEEIHWPQKFVKEEDIICGLCPSRKGNWWRTSGKGRYKAIFHWNERIAQMSLFEPVIPVKVLERIFFEAFSGKYGSLEDFTRADIVIIFDFV